MYMPTFPSLEGTLSLATVLVWSALGNAVLANAPLPVPPIHRGKCRPGTELVGHLDP